MEIGGISLKISPGGRTTPTRGLSDPDAWKKLRNISYNFIDESTCSDLSERLPLLDSHTGRSIEPDECFLSTDDLTISSQPDLPKTRSYRSILKQVKIAVIFIIILSCCVIFIINPEITVNKNQLSVDKYHPKIAIVDFSFCVLELTVLGPLKETVTLQNDTESKSLVFLHINHSNVMNEMWNLTVRDINLEDGHIFRLEHTFKVPSCSESRNVKNKYEILIESTCNDSVPLTLSYRSVSTAIEHQIVFAAVILFCVYGLIILDLVHRTLAAILGSFAALTVLSYLNERPTLETVLGFLDIETLALLFGMMIIVSIFSDTGFFDYCALMAYKLARGNVWTLITILCVLAGVISAFLDNVTTILLLTPVTIRLCEVLNLDPKHILIAEVLFSNIGGTATAIGDPPNVIIVSDKDMAHLGVEFSNFTGHLVLGIFFISIAAYGLMRFMYRNMEMLQKPDPPEVSEAKHEIDIWRKASSRINVVTREESMVKALLLQKVATLENVVIKLLQKQKKTKKRDYQSTLIELEKKYCIQDKVLLVKCSVILVGVILLFFLHSFISELHTGLGWIAIIGAILLLILADVEDLDSIIHRVEWSTLIFFAALFTLMEALMELGLIKWIGDNVAYIIEQMGEDYRLTVALILIVWISAIASSFIDNIPYTTAMVPVLVSLSENEELHLPIMPLALALAFGACLGGNGTLIGASANVVCAGIADQHGCGFTFFEFFKVGFPMMLLTSFLAMVYLLICHVGIGWNT